MEEGERTERAERCGEGQKGMRGRQMTLSLPLSLQVVLLPARLMFIFSPILCYKLGSVCQTRLSRAFSAEGSIVLVFWQRAKGFWEELP